MRADRWLLREIFASWRPLPKSRFLSLYQGFVSLILAQLFRLARIARPRQKKVVKSALATAVLCIAPALALAQNSDRWISDQFEVTLRTGKNIQQSIIKLLPSGTKVTVLEQDDQTGYARVRTSEGEEGWLLTRYLISSPTARMQLPQLETQLRKSEETKKQLQVRIRDLEREQKDLQIQLRRAETSSRGLQHQLDEIRSMSSDTIKLNHQIQQLKQTLTDAERNIQELESERRKLSDKSSREWFIVGAAVLLFGVILGLIIPRIRWQKKPRLTW